MHTQLINRLRKEFPGKKVIAIGDGDPKEIIVELGGDENFSEALALIDRSEPHVHCVTHEEYFVEKGVLTVHVDGDWHILRKGDSIVIQPGQVHWAEGVAVRVRVIASPPWTPGDHILVDID